MATISVLMPVFNCEKYIRTSVESILDQTWNDFEFIIINDGSTDRSLDILKTYNDARIKIINCATNGGVAKARNIGLEACSADYIALMDSDDFAFKDRLEKQYYFLKNHPEADAVYARYSFIDADGNSLNLESPKAYDNPKYVRAYMLLNDTIGNAGTLFKREIVIRNNLKYDETCKITSDYKFWCDYIEFGNFIGMDEVLWSYRVRSDSLYTGSPLSRLEEYEHKTRSYHLKKYGFVFNEKEMQILLQVFVFGKIITGEDIKLLYEVLHSMMKQAKQNQLSFAEEVRVMCKNRFLEKVQNAEQLWLVE